MSFPCNNASHLLGRLGFFMQGTIWVWGGLGVKHWLIFCYLKIIQITDFIVSKDRWHFMTVIFVVGNDPTYDSFFMQNGGCPLNRPSILIIF